MRNIPRPFTYGAALSLFMIFFTVASTAILLAMGQGIFTDLATLNSLAESKQSFAAVEALTEDVVYRRTYGTYNIDTVESLLYAGAVVYATTTYDSLADVYTVESQATFRDAVRKTTSELSITNGTNLSYGLLSGVGGIDLANSAQVIGDTYANGPITGAGSATVIGDIASAGPAGLVKNVTVTGSVFADTIDGNDIHGDAYYNTQIGTDAQNPVAGTRFTPVSNQPLSDFPLSSSTIQEWKDAVTNYGTVITAGSSLCSSGEYVIDTTITIGYVRIECDVNVRNNGTTLVLTGPVWVEGNISFTQGPTIKIDPSLGRRSVQMMADNSADRLTSSRIEIRNATDFFGSGDSRSYILLWSANESSATGGGEVAVNIQNSADGDVIMYAAEGLVDVSNGVELRAVTGHQIDVAQNSDIIYENGLSNLLFTAGPGSGYVLTDWEQSE